MGVKNYSQEASAAELDIEQLREGCHFCLGQCDRLLAELTVEDYVCATEVSSIGAHVRHILERFQCFLAGLPEQAIDYDARKRDKSLESNPQSAAFALASILRRIDELDLSQFANNGNIAAANVSVRESVHPQLGAVLVNSTLERELLSLISHSIHHLAIIAMLAKPLGYEFGDDFGKAPSTIIHEQG